MNRADFIRWCNSAPAWLRFHPVDAVEVKIPGGQAKVLIGESHRLHDPEYPEPHIQHIYTVDMDGQTDIVMQKLYYGLDKPENKTREARIAATVEIARNFIEASVDSGRFSH